MNSGGGKSSRDGHHILMHLRRKAVRSGLMDSGLGNAGPLQILRPGVDGQARWPAGQDSQGSFLTLPRLPLQVGQEGP